VKAIPKGVTGITMACFEKGATIRKQIVKGTTIVLLKGTGIVILGGLYYVRREKQSFFSKERQSFCFE